MPMHGCTDVNVQDVYFWFLEYWNLWFGTDVVMPLGFLDVLNPLDTVVSHFFSDPGAAWL